MARSNLGASFQARVTLGGHWPGVPSLACSGSQALTARMLVALGALAASGALSASRMAQPLNPLLKESSHNQGFLIGLPRKGQHLISAPLSGCKSFMSSLDGIVVLSPRISSGWVDDGCSPSFPGGTPSHRHFLVEARISSQSHSSMAPSQWLSPGNL